MNNTDTLTKASLTDSLSQVTGLPRVESLKIIESFFETIASSLENGYEVKINGFGIFRLRDKSARPGRNPLTKEPVEIEERRVVSWTASKKLKGRTQANERKDK